MALLNAGYWPTTYWPSSYWDPDYWPKYGTAAPSAPVSRGGVARRRRRVEPRRFMGKRQLQLLRDYLRLKLGEENA